MTILGSDVLTLAYPAQLGHLLRLSLDPPVDSGLEAARVGGDAPPVSLALQRFDESHGAYPRTFLACWTADPQSRSSISRSPFRVTAYIHGPGPPLSTNSVILLQCLVSTARLIRVDWLPLPVSTNPRIEWRTHRRLSTGRDRIFVSRDTTTRPSRPTTPSHSSSWVPHGTSGRAGCPGWTTPPCNSSSARASPMSVSSAKKRALTMVARSAALTPPAPAVARDK